MRSWLLLWALLGGCGAPVYEAGPEVFSAPGEHIGDDWIFSSARINRIDLEIPEESMEVLRAERRFSYPRFKVRASAVIDGEEVGEVGVRLRGGLGSYQPIDKKPKLELDLNEYSGERFYGLESLSLNNMAEECLGLREALVFAAYAKVGLPSHRTGYAQLFLNGQDYGLYTVIESADDRWLRRNYPDPDGNFYDGKYVFAGNWPKFVDFARDRDEWFDLEEGEDVDFADIRAISQGIYRAEDAGGAIDEPFRRLVDWPALALLLRVEQWTGNSDGYGTAVNNYRVYFQPGGPMQMSAWDVDNSLAIEPLLDEDDEPTGRFQVVYSPSETRPRGRLSEACLADAECEALWRHTQVSARLQDGELRELAEALIALTREGKLGDPRSICEDIDYEGQTEALLSYLERGGD